VPSLDLRFADNKSLVDAVTGANLVTFTRASSGTFVGSDGVLQTAATDAPRFDHNPTTGESLGLLVEEQRTNSIRNSVGVGAVAGTPGTLPTNWSVAVASDLTTNVIGTGISAGVPYIDLQIVGTSNSTSYIFAFESNSQIAALQNQNWSESLWISHVAGSFANISATSLNIRQSNILGSQVAATVVTFSQPTSTLARVSGTATFSEVTTAFVTPGFRLTIANGAAIDITLRIGLPQLEQGAFATSVIPTSTTAVTRAADVASITGSAFSSWYRQDEGTVFAEYQPSKVVNATTWDISSATNENYNLRYASASQLQSAGSVGGVTQWNIAPAGYSATGLRYKTALGIKVNDIAQSAQGIITGSDSLASIPSANKIDIGQSRTGGDVGVLTIRRLTYWPKRLSTGTLESITRQ
jgi:hypothetical protein